MTNPLCLKQLLTYAVLPGKKVISGLKAVKRLPPTVGNVVYEVPAP